MRKIPKLTHSKSLYHLFLFFARGKATFFEKNTKKRPPAWGALSISDLRIGVRGDRGAEIAAIGVQDVNFFKGRLCLHEV